MIPLFITAFITGFFGSLHCAGMCGPLALSFNLNNKGNPVVQALVYNIARIFTYVLLGFLFGAIGLSFAFTGLQQFSSIFMGIVIIFLVAIQFFAHSMRVPFLNTYTNYIKIKIGNAYSNKSTFQVFILGFLNGLLPCGLVYLALAGAVASGNFLNGGLYMLLFGLGTLPLMFSAAAFGNYLGSKRLLIRKYLPVFSLLIASLLILRGLNLGIPFISPHFDSQTATIECCEIE